MHGFKNKVHLGVEALEERALQACAVAFGAGVLTITGNLAPDVVQLQDHGNGVVTGFATGWGAFGFGGVKEIKVSTEAGDDQVFYNLVNDLQAMQSRVLNIGLGDGNDLFFANLYKPAAMTGADILNGASLVMGIGGGNGDDTIRVKADQDVDVGVGGRLKVIEAGHDGNDLLTMHWRGENDGAVALRDADGGAGRDKIRAVLTEDLGSTGALAAQMHGGDHGDTLALFMFTNKVPVLALLDGGADTDTAAATANVTVVNVP